MPKFLVEASYTAEGAKGLMKAGGSARRAAVQKMVESGRAARGVLLHVR